MKRNAFFLGLSLLILLFLSARIPDASEETVKEAPQSVKGIQLKDSYHFAGEALPLEKQDVRERMDRELLVNTFWHSSTMLNIKRSKKFFPVIEKILAEQGVPGDFKYLCVAESNLSNVVSPAGAAGYWQFLKSTGESYDLEINKYVDERNHIEKSTLAACKYLIKAKEKFGSWTMAAASYNMGMNGLDKQVALQQSNNYYELNLSIETMRYIFRIIALKEIISDPSSFGIELDETNYYSPLENYYSMEVDSSINSLAHFAKKFGASYRDLKYYNPWLISHTLPNMSGRKYVIRVPKKNG